MILPAHISSNEYKAIVIGGSAGSLPVITKIMQALPASFDIPIILCLHRLKHIRHGFLEALSIRSAKTIIEPTDKESIKNGMVYLAPANYHLLLELGNYISLSTEPMVNNSRPSIDLTFESASYVYKQKLIALLLSGANKDGARGMKKVKQRNGLAIVQDPLDCTIDTMPKSAMECTDVDLVLTSDQIVSFLLQLDRLQTLKKTI